MIRLVRRNLGLLFLLLAVVRVLYGAGVLT